MTGQFIIAKGINRAIHGGYPYTSGFAPEYVYQDGKPAWTGRFSMTPKGEDRPVIKHYLEILFDPNFAFCIWGDSLVSPADGGDYMQTAYHHQMQRMVVAKDRIKFLEDSL